MEVLGKNRDAHFSICLMRNESGGSMVESPGTDLPPPVKPGVNRSYAAIAWIALPVFAITLPAYLWQPPILWLIYGVYAVGLVAAGRCMLDAKQWWSKGLFGVLTGAYLGLGWLVISSGVRDLLR